jgi:BlaI family penicillinase repressor
MPRLSALQLAVMRVLWSHGRVTVAQVQQHLESPRPLAYSTLATVLRRLEDRGFVRHIAAGRSFVYEPVLQPDEVGQSLISDLLQHVFGGSASRLVCHLLETRDIQADELARIQQLLQQYAQRRDDSAATEIAGEP